MKVTLPYHLTLWVLLMKPFYNRGFFSMRVFITSQKTTMSKCYIVSEFIKQKLSQLNL
jgi:hypothetical protein